MYPEMSLMLCPSVLKCVTTGKKKSFTLNKMISHSPLDFSNGQLITALTGNTMNSCGEAKVVLGNKNGSLRACNFHGWVKY